MLSGSFQSHNQPKEAPDHGTSYTISSLPYNRSMYGEERSSSVARLHYHRLVIELNKRISKTSTTLSKHTKRVWENKILQFPLKWKSLCRKPASSALLFFGSESRTAYSTRQEQKLEVFHLSCLPRILGITWQDKVPNNDVLLRAGIPSMFTLLRQRRLRCLDHVHGIW